MPKSNKKYVIFPSIILILTIVITFIGHSLGSVYEVLNKYDITGMTKIVMYGLLIFETSILIICIYKGKKGLKEGYDYIFSKFVCIIFVILTIIPIISFFVIRSEEEKLAVDVEEQSIESLEQLLLGNNKKNQLNSEIDEYFNMRENDKFYNRKQDILNETKNKNKNIFLEYFIFNRYNYHIFYKNYLTMEERYYAIFSSMSIISIICLAFYLTSWLVDESLNKRGEILE